MLESRFQSSLIRELKFRFPGCMVLKTDPSYIQGLPDLLILYGSTWAALECKRVGDARRQVNQDFYVTQLNDMSFASFISPETKEEVLDELQTAFRSRR